MPPSKGRGRKKKTRKKIDGAKNATDNTTKEFRDELLSRVLYINSETAKEQAALTEFQQRVENMTLFWVIEKEKLEVSQHCLCFLRKISFSFFLHLRSESAPVQRCFPFYSSLYPRSSLQDKKACCETKEAELQSFYDIHRLSVDAKREEIKSLLCEQQDEVATERARVQAELKTLQVESRNEECNLISDRHACCTQRREFDSSHSELLNNLRGDHCLRIAEILDRHQHKVSEISNNAKSRMEKTRKELRMEVEGEAKVIEEATEHSARLALQCHERELERSRSHHNRVVHKNLDAIKNLQEQIEAMRKEHFQRKKLLSQLSRKNKEIVEPLSEGRRSLDLLSKEQELCEVQKKELGDHRDRLRIVTNEFSDLKWRHEVLFQNYELIISEGIALREEALSLKINARQKQMLETF